MGGVVSQWEPCACGWMCRFVAAAGLCAQRCHLNPKENSHWSSGDPLLPGILDVPCCVVNCEGRSYWWSSECSPPPSHVSCHNWSTTVTSFKLGPPPAHLDGTHACVGGIIPVIIFKISFSIFYTLSAGIKGASQRPQIRKCHRIIDFGKNLCKC